MIEVTLVSSQGRDVVEADTPEDAIFAGRTIWDESCESNPYQGWQRGLLLTFAVDGKVVRCFEGTRP